MLGSSKELKLRDHPPIMENHMEKKMENEMEIGNIGQLIGILWLHIQSIPFECL